MAGKRPEKEEEGEEEAEAEAAEDAETSNDTAPGGGGWGEKSGNKASHRGEGAGRMARSRRVGSRKIMWSWQMMGRQKNRRSNEWGADEDERGAAAQ